LRLWSYTLLIVVAVFGCDGRAPATPSENRVAPVLFDRHLAAAAVAVLRVRFVAVGGAVNDGVVVRQLPSRVRILAVYKNESGVPLDGEIEVFDSRDYPMPTGISTIYLAPGRVWAGSMSEAPPGAPGAHPTAWQLVLSFNGQPDLGWSHAEPE
jgi:hypothetical protein